MNCRLVCLLLSLWSCGPGRVVMSNYPPDCYETKNGAVWPTDITYSESGSAISGDGYVLFTATTPAANPGFGYADFIPAIAGRAYAVRAYLYASSIAAGNIVQLGIEWYDNTGTIISTSYAWNAVLPAATTWYDVAGQFEAPATTKYAVPVVYKANNAFTVRLNDLELLPMRIGFHANRTFAQSIPAAAVWTKVQANAKVHDYGSNYDTANYRFTAPRTGVYSFAGHVQYWGVPTTNTAMVALYLNGSQWLLGNWVSSANTFPGPIVSHPGALLQRGDYVELFTAHDDPVNPHDIVGGSQYTYFIGTQVD